MAALTSSRLYDLIERLLFSRRDGPSAVFDIVRTTFSAVRDLAETDPPSSREADAAWLQRIELRGPERVLHALETSGFRERTGTIEALFVDDRCGLIMSRRVGNAADIDPSKAVADILRSALSCHASGVVLATHDFAGLVSRTPRSRKLTMDLRRKGEAIEVFLLDHFVLTAEGWKRMISLTGKDRI